MIYETGETVETGEDVFLLRLSGLDCGAVPEFNFIQSKVGIRA